MKYLRTRSEIEHAMEILLHSVKGASNPTDKKVSAMAAMTLAWVLRWEDSGTRFQEMLDACDAHDLKEGKRHRHRKDKDSE